jgi:signal transduction histidine kinase
MNWMLKGFNKSFVILLFSVFYIYNPLHADVIYLQKDQTKNIDINAIASYYEDEKCQYSFNDIIEFTYSEQQLPINLGISKKCHWVKFSLVIDTNDENYWLELASTSVDEVYFYLFRNNELLDSVIYTHETSIHEKNLGHQHFLYELKPDSGSEYTLIFKLKSNKQLIVPFKIYTHEDLFKSMLNRDLLAGIYFGLILIMLLYNLFIYFTVRDTNYIYYVSYLFSIGITQMVLLGYGYRYLWPKWPWLAEQSVFLVGVISGVFTVVFSIKFLKLRVYFPNILYILYIYLALYFSAFMLSLLGYFILSYTIINFNAAASLLLVFAAIVVVRKGYRPAKFYLLALSFFLVGVTIFVLKDVGILPYNLFTNYALMMGSGIEMLLLSFALADRINSLQAENARNQKAAFEALSENEKIIREQNVLLEYKVNERTKELKLANEELNKALEELKEAQIQLVNAEKMASLGQLTAGIAHEINNPINFVTSNIIPLKRDIDDLLSLLNKYEEVMKKYVDNEEIKAIEVFRKQLDIDYTIEEIDTLLTGIREGAVRTAEIVKGLKNFTRLDEDESKIADINEGIQSTALLLRNSLGTIELKLELTDIPRISCYPGKLNQVLLNMMNNGIHAINKRHKGERGGTLTVKTEELEKYIKISICDNGIGMSDEVKNKIFEPFFTTKEVGEGSGLGLSIVYSILQKHNANVEVESIENEGTCFHISIPKEMGS